MTEAKWAISTDGEYYSGDFPSREEAISEGTADELEKFWVGRCREPRPLSQGIYADQILESAIDGMEEDYGFDFDGFEAMPDQVADLQNRLRAVMDQWILDHKLTPQWFCIDDAEEIRPDYPE